MKVLKKEWKWMVLWTLPILCMSMLSIFAYFTVGAEVVNPFQIGGNQISIIEEFEPEAIKPGKQIKKKVCVRNDGPNACYVRIRVLFSDSYVGDYAKVDWNLTDWVYNAEDQFYYYKQSVQMGEVTSNLMTQIEICADIPEENITDVDVLVYAESYQADGFTDYQEAWQDYQKNGG